MVAICSVHGGYHHYSVPMEDDKWARRCECGEVQRYKPHAGKPAVFTDVLVEAEDLRYVLEQAVSLLELHGFAAADDEVITRLYALLD
jgi:hypothetical protein